jgi:hypothetical protein
MARHDVMGTPDARIHWGSAAVKTPLAGSNLIEPGQDDLRLSARSEVTESSRGGKRPTSDSSCSCSRRSRRGSHRNHHRSGSLRRSLGRNLGRNLGRSLGRSLCLQIAGLEARASRRFPCRRHRTSTG